MEGQGLTKVRPSAPAARAAMLQRRVGAQARAFVRVRMRSRAKLQRSCVAGAPQADRKHALPEHSHTVAARELCARTRRAAAPGFQLSARCRLVQDGGRAARAALPPVLQSVEELKSIVASARYAPVPPPPPQHLSAAERCACRRARAELPA